MTRLPTVAKRVGRRWLNTLSPRNLCVLAGILAVIYVAATVTGYAHTLDGNQAEGGPIGGDYAAFYAAGRLVLQGQVGQIYDTGVVRAFQQAATSGGAPDFYVAYRNPPFFALVLAPFATLDLVPSFAAWGLVSVALLVVAVTLTLRTLPRLRAHWKLVALAIAGFCPVYSGLIDGQNAAVSLLLYVLVYLALREGRDGRAGVVAALGLFKPQLFFVLPLVFLAGRRWRALAFYSATAAVLVLVSVALVGLDGAIAWAHIIVGYEPANAAKLAGRMYSLKAFFDVLLPGEASLALTLSLVCSLVVLGLVACSWMSGRAFQQDLPLRFAFTILAALLVDPHLLDYDLTVLVLPALLIVGVLPGMSWWLAAMFAVTAIDVPLTIGPMDLQVGVMLLVALAGWVWWRLERNQRVRPLLHSIELPQFQQHGGMRAA